MDGVIIESPPLDVFGQMALDETLAQSRPSGFALRFFRWRGVGATFGYTQRIREVEKALPPEAGTAYTRRPTGGGIVPHFDDLTFSCVFPAAGELRPMVLYRRLHAAVLSGLREAGLEAGLCDPDRPPPPRGGGASRCFAAPVALDILADGRKILGGAIRRHGETVLYQGSLQLPGARQRAAELEAAIARRLASEWDAAWERRETDAAWLAAAEALSARFRSPEWIRRI